MRMAPARSPAVEEPGLRAELHAPQGVGGFGHDDRGTRIATQMPGLDVIGREPQVEPAVAPFVPDRREQDRTVRAKRRQDRDERLVEEPTDVVEGQVRAHGSPYPAPSSRRPVRIESPSRTTPGVLG